MQNSGFISWLEGQMLFGGGRAPGRLEARGGDTSSAVSSVFILPIFQEALHDCPSPQQPRPPPKDATTLNRTPVPVRVIPSGFLLCQIPVLNASRESLKASWQSCLPSGWMDFGFCCPNLGQAKSCMSLGPRQWCLPKQVLT